MQLLAATQRLRKDEGGFLQHLLQRAMCGDNYCKTLENFESSLGVTYNGIELHELLYLQFYNDETLVRFQRLSEYKTAYLDGIDAQLEKYMPSNNLMKTMAALDQTTWPADIMGVLTDNRLMTEIKKWPKLFETLSYPDDEFEQDFRRVISWLNLNKEWWCEKRQSTPENFWSDLLTSPARLLMTNKMVSLLKSTLCSPYGSADAERCFSK